MRKIFIWLLAGVVSLSSCALQSSNRKIAITGNVVIYESLAAIQDTADTLRSTNVITQEQRVEISKYLLPALQTGQQIAKLTKEWPADKPAPAELQTLVGQLKTFVDQLLAKWPDSPGKAALATRLAQAQQAVLALIMIFAGQGGQ